MRHKTRICLSHSTMNFGHASKFATRTARELTGELYPGPVLMPRGLLRALDPLLALFLGPATEGGADFEAAIEEMLRGRPDGPLMLATWASVTSGEIPHKLVRSATQLMRSAPPESPATRGDLLAWLHPRASVMARFALSLAERDNAATLAPAERLACGFALTRILTDLPRALTAGRLLLPLEDLEKAGLTREELMDGIYTPAVQAFLAQECAWARQLLEDGRPTCERVGDRMARGLRAAILRADRLLRGVEKPSRDVFRHPPRVGAYHRTRFAIRAWWPLHPLA
ncbi:MAG: squalene/phytoene synthase family protein [Planctomycetes bacterium]|nr:squalene/phytoene synthase family protein [Planctomycetota bacterium]MBT4029067.1 squalene/phytoene synthase family protein [Planctomycetota bacterium]MBT4560313.1 squalene/phytoene synthase family protein [Planctomycetota bacterium]MBT7012004.1 squalene/phytoene synthase family protein [Planctomycetota bacterium]MBT7318103.1 squalene/phytoene synthase family protein [Planctomycetota bacterium]